MALRNKIYSKAKKRNYSNFFLSFLFILTLLIILFNKTDHIIISKLKNFGLDVVNPITRIVSFPALVINNAALKIN